MAALRYSVAGRAPNTAATANHCAAQLWNPSTTISIYVHEIHVAQTTATVSNLMVSRSTARGATPATTVTPDIDSNYEGVLAPASAAVLELALFSTQPTLAVPPRLQWNLPAAIGSGLMWVFAEPWRVLPTNGICVATPVAVILQAADYTFVWTE